MASKKKEEKIGEALLKVALGYQVAEVTEEYAEVDGALKLTKRKKTKKDVPPDLKAVQILLETRQGDSYGSWTDEELEEERQRLLEKLQESESPKEKSAQTTAAKTGRKKATKTTAKSKARVKTKK
jgi:hypothetical protein